MRKILALPTDDEENSVNHSVDNMSWTAYHARKGSAGRQVIYINALPLLFNDSAHTVTMVKHAMGLVRKAVQHLSAGQTPVVTLEQPLYAIATISLL